MLNTRIPLHFKGSHDAQSLGSIGPQQLSDDDSREQELRVKAATLGKDEFLSDEEIKFINGRYRIQRSKPPKSEMLDRLREKHLESEPLDRLKAKYPGANKYSDSELFDIFDKKHSGSTLSGIFEKELGNSISVFQTGLDSDLPVKTFGPAARKGIDSLEQIKAANYLLDQERGYTDESLLRATLKLRAAQSAEIAPAVEHQAPKKRSLFNWRRSPKELKPEKELKSESHEIAPAIMHQALEALPKTPRLLNAGEEAFLAAMEESSERAEVRGRAGKYNLSRKKGKVQAASPGIEETSKTPTNSTSRHASASLFSSAPIESLEKSTKLGSSPARLGSRSKAVMSPIRESRSFQNDTKTSEKAESPKKGSPSSKRGNWRSYPGIKQVRSITQKGIKL
jgi:hypothetical protein